MRHILGLATALLLALTARAGIGPEVPLSSDVTLGPAAYSQDSPAVASNGRDFLVAWTDNVPTGTAVRAVRVGADGAPAGHLSRRIAANARSPEVAAVGSDYLVIWADSGGIQAQRVDSDGVPLAAAHTAAPPSIPFELVSDGSTALLVTINDQYTPAQSISAILLDGDGNPLRTTNIGSNTPLAAGVHNGRYVIIDVAMDCSGSECRYSPFLRTLGEDGTATAVSLPVISALTNLWVCAAFSPDTILLGWQALSSPAIAAGYTIVGFDGRVIRPAQSIVPTDQFAGHFAPAAGWDGHQFLFVFARIGFTAGAFRITADGTVLDRPPLLLMSKASNTAPVFASNGTAQLLVWTDRRFSTFGDIVGRAVPDFDAVAQAPDQATLISYGSAAQTSVHVARSAAAVFGVWSDESNKAVSGAVNGQPVAIAKVQDDSVGLPAVAAGARVFLVAWNEWTGSAGQLLAKRFDFAGHDLDPQPLLLGAAIPQQPYLSQVSTAIAFDGSAFLVAWTNGDLYTVRIGEEGAPYDARHNVVVGTLETAHSPSAFWTGAEFFVGYGIERLSLADPHVPVPAAISALRIGTAVADQQPPPVLFEGIGSRHVPVAAALGDDRVTFAWATFCATDPCVAIAQSSRDRAPLMNPRFAAPLGTFFTAPVDIAWDGSAFVVVWTDWSAAAGWKVRGIHVSRTGTPIESEPFEISSGVNGLPPAVIGTPTGALVAYSRADDTGVPRAFMRTIDRFLPAPPRRRAAAR